MPLVRVKANFDDDVSFGFYGTKRRYNGEEFSFNYDPEKKGANGSKIPLEKQLGSWMELLEKPKRSAAKVSLTSELPTED